MQLKVEGELGIGAFSLTWDDPTTGTADAPDVEVTCPAVADGSEDSPLMGNVKGTEEMPNDGHRQHEQQHGMTAAPRYVWR